jgi:hypothetical protein
MFQTNNDSSEQRFDPKEMLEKLAEKYQDDQSWLVIKDALEKSISRQTTCGEYESEDAACIGFDALINKDYFINEHEVKGRRLFDDKPADCEQKVRIDRVLFPTQRAFDAGWIHGPIAVEIKKSNMAVGPIFSQVLEYRQSIFISKLLRNTRIMPLVFAIFPVQNITRDLHSLQENQIILSCYPKKTWPDHGNMLRLDTYGKVALEIMPNDIRVGGSFRPNTRKGHRGREK